MGIGGNSYRVNTEVSLQSKMSHQIPEKAQGGTAWGSAYKYINSETSLVVQWLRICLPMLGTQVQSLVGKLRSHMPQGN